MKLANALENIDDDLLVEAMDTVPKGKSKKILRWGILAACLILLIGTATVAAATWIANGFSWEPLSQSPDKDPYGYRVYVPIDPIPLSALTGEIQEIPAIILTQVENHQKYDSILPTHFFKQFSAPEDALAYIGLSRLHIPNLDLEPDQTTFSSNSLDTTGEIQVFTLMIHYRDPDMSINAIATVYTEHWTGDGVISFSYPEHENQEFTESLYTTHAGLACHIISGRNTDGPHHSMNAFLVCDGILYSYFSSYAPADEARAEEILHQWADQFG